MTPDRVHTVALMAAQLLGRSDRLRPDLAVADALQLYAEAERQVKATYKIGAPCSCNISRDTCDRHSDD